MKIELNNIYCSDWLVFMEAMRDQNISVNTCFTSPPYWQLRDYKHPDQLGQESTVEEYIQHLVEGYRLLSQVLTPDGSFFLNIGDSYAYKQLQMIPAQVALALQKEGYILRNSLVWTKPNSMPSSVKDRWANSYEMVYFFTKKNMTGPFWWILLNRPKADPTKANYEKQVEKQQIWDQAIQWWGNAIIKPYEEVPEEYRIVGYKFSYYFALDLIRKPHKTASLEKYQRQINVGLEGANKESKYFQLNEQKNLGQLGGRGGVPRWFKERFGVDKNYRGKFDNFQQQTFGDPEQIAQEVLQTPEVRNLQFNKEWRHTKKHKSASQQQRLEMYNPKGTAPKDVTKIEVDIEDDGKLHKKNTLLAFLTPTANTIDDQSAQKQGREHARSSESPSKYDGEFRGGMALPPNPNEKGAFHPLGKNPRDVLKTKSYDAWYEASHIVQSIKTKGHGDKASTVARLAAGLVDNHPLGKNPRDVIGEIEIPSDVFELFLEWLEGQTFADDVFEITTRSFKGSHFAVFPRALVRDPLRVTLPPNGVAFDPMCVHPKTYILTKSSVKFASTIKIGDEVLTSEGKFKRVINIFSREVTEPLIEIISYGRKLLLTNNHPVLIWRQKGRNWQYKTNERVKPRWIVAGELKKDDYVAFPLLNISENNGEYPSNEMVELFGWFLSEGCSDKHSLHFYSEDKSILKHIQELLKKVYGKGQIKDRYVIINDINLARFYRRNFGIKAKNKKIPIWVKELPIHKLKYLLRGMIFGDGYISIRKKCEGIKYRTSSPHLMWDLIEILTKFNIFPYISVSYPDGKTRWTEKRQHWIQQKVPSYLISIEGKQRYTLEDILNIKFTPKATNQFWFKFNNFIWARIRSIKSIPYSGTVYNFEIEDDHTYVANGILVHNCGRGTVGAVAFEQGRNFLLCDLVPKYVQIAKEFVQVGQRRLV